MKKRREMRKSWLKQNKRKRMKSPIFQSEMTKCSFKQIKANNFHLFCFLQFGKTPADRRQRNASVLASVPGVTIYARFLNPLQVSYLNVISWLQFLSLRKKFSHVYLLFLHQFFILSMEIKTFHRSGCVAKP